MKKLKSFNPLFRLLFPIIHGHLAYVLVLLFFDNTNQLFTLFFRQEVLFLIVVSYFFNEGFILIVKWMDKRYEDASMIKNRFVAQILVSLLFTLFIVSTLTFVYFYYVIQSSVFKTELLVFISIYTISCLLLNLYSFSLIYLNTQNDSMMLEENQKKMFLSYQIQAFQNEVNPHFFYQSLESLIIIGKNGGRVVDDFVGKLSAVYRYKLDNQQSEVVSLNDQLTLIENLLYLLNFSFGHTLSFNQEALTDKERQVLLITSSLGDMVLYIVHSTIITQNTPLEIKLKISENGDFLQCVYQGKDRILIDEEIQKIWLLLQNAYSRLSSLTIKKDFFEEQIIINIPILNLEEGVL